MMYISTSVKQATAVVVLQPAVPTQLAVSRVAVYLDTVEMDLRVKVSHVEIQMPLHLGFCPDIAQAVRVKL